MIHQTVYILKIFIYMPGRDNYVIIGKSTLIPVAPLSPSDCNLKDTWVEQESLPQTETCTSCLY